MYDDVIFDELSIANGFNNYFINVPKKILNNIVIPPEFNNMENYFGKLPLQNNTFSFDEVNESEILNIIDKLKNTNSSGIDKISNKAIKFIKNLIATPLALIINQSLIK